MFYLELLINGLITGSIYALIALGFVLIYKASRMANFAHGEFVTYAALFVATARNAWGWSLLASLAFGVVAMAVLAVAINVLLLRFIIGRPAITAIMVTLGLGGLLQGAARFAFPEVGIKLPMPPAMEAPVFLGEIMVSPMELGAGLIACVTIAAMSAFFLRSRTGLALRAIADDQQAAMGMGIPVQRHFVIAWTLAGIAAVIGGTLWGQVFGFGFGLGLLGLKVFPIVIIGGLESIVGVIVGGLGIGVLERMAAGTMEGLIGSGSANFLPYIVMIIVLMIRPYGIFGTPEVERV